MWNTRELEEFEWADRLKHFKSGSLWSSKWFITSEWLLVWLMPWGMTVELLCGVLVLVLGDMRGNVWKETNSCTSIKTHTHIMNIHCMVNTQTYLFIHNLNCYFVRICTNTQLDTRMHPVWASQRCRISAFCVQTVCLLLASSSCESAAGNKWSVTTLLTLLI